MTSPCFGKGQCSQLTSSSSMLILSCTLLLTSGSLNTSGGWKRGWGDSALVWGNGDHWTWWRVICLILNPFYFPFMLNYLFFCTEFKQVTLKLVGQLIGDLETASIQNLLRKSRGFKLILRNKKTTCLKKDFLKLHFRYVDFESLEKIRFLMLYLEAWV